MKLLRPFRGQEGLDFDLRKKNLRGLSMMDIIEKINGPRYFVDDCTISGVANGIVSTIEASY